MKKAVILRTLKRKYKKYSLLGKSRLSFHLECKGDQRELKYWLMWRNILISGFR